MEWKCSCTCGRNLPKSHSNSQSQNYLCLYPLDLDMQREHFSDSLTPQVSRERHGPSQKLKHTEDLGDAVPAISQATQLLNEERQQVSGTRRQNPLHLWVTLLPAWMESVALPPTLGKQTVTRNSPRGLCPAGLLST